MCLALPLRQRKFEIKLEEVLIVLAFEDTIVILFEAATLKAGVEQEEATEEVAIAGVKEDGSAIGGEEKEEGGEIVDARKDFGRTHAAETSKEELTQLVLVIMMLVDEVLLDLERILLVDALYEFVEANSVFEIGDAHHLGEKASHVEVYHCEIATEDLVGNILVLKAAAHTLYHHHALADNAADGFCGVFCFGKEFFPFVVDFLSHGLRETRASLEKFEVSGTATVEETRGDAAEAIQDTCDSCLLAIDAEQDVEGTFAHTSDALHLDVVEEGFHSVIDVDEGIASTFSAGGSRAEKFSSVVSGVCPKFGVDGEALCDGLAAFFGILANAGYFDKGSHDTVHFLFNAAIGAEPILFFALNAFEAGGAAFDGETFIVAPSEFRFAHDLHESHEFYPFFSTDCEHYIE